MIIERTPIYQMQKFSHERTTNVQRFETCHRPFLIGESTLRVDRCRLIRTILHSLEFSSSDYISLVARWSFAGTLDHYRTSTDVTPLTQNCRSTVTRSGNLISTCANVDAGESRCTLCGSVCRTGTCVIRISESNSHCASANHSRSWIARTRKLTRPEI